MTCEAVPSQQPAAVFVSRQEYEALQAQVALLEKIILNNNLGGGNQEQPVMSKEEEEEEKMTETEGETPPPAPQQQPTSSLCDQVKHKANEVYVVQATSMTQMISSVNLLEHFQLFTAFVIAGIAMLIKLTFAAALTTYQTKTCTPTRTIIDGDWPPETYQEIYNENNKQFLCTSEYINQFQFRIGNARHREQHDPDFGYTDPHVDLSQFGYNWVWTGYNKGLLRSVPWGQVGTNHSMAGRSQQETTWHRFVDVKFIDDCARQCGEINARHGFHAFDGPSETWECMCGFKNVDNSNTTVCLADYKAEASHCLAQEMYDGGNVRLYFWNDTYYAGKYLMVFSSEDSPREMARCSDAAELKDLCPESNDYDYVNITDGYGERWINDTDRPAGVFWDECTLPGFTCADYNHESCKEYGPRCGGQVGIDGGDNEVPCAGLVSVTYISCPPVSVTLGSTLGYLSYVELVTVILLSCLFLWWRGDNPWHVLRENSILLLKAIAQEQQREKQKDEDADETKVFTNAVLNQKGLEGTLTLPTPKATAPPPPPPPPEVPQSTTPSSSSPRPAPVLDEEEAMEC